MTTIKYIEKPSVVPSVDRLTDKESKLPHYYNDVYKCYLGYRQCYSRDLEENTVAEKLAVTTEEEKDTLLNRYMEYCTNNSIQLSDGDKTALCNEVESWEHGYEFLKMCWFIYQHANHDSQLEHITIQFQFKDMSRACQQQWTRHRLQILGIQSQRYIDFFSDKDTEAKVYIPASIAANPEALKIYKEYLEQLPEVVSKIKALGDKHIKDEDIRYLYPNALCSDGMVTINLRSLLHILNERLCSKAQKEIRDFAYVVAKHLKKELPFIGLLCEPKCMRLGHCPELNGCGYYKYRRVIG